MRYRVIEEFEYGRAFIEECGIDSKSRRFCIDTEGKILFEFPDKKIEPTGFCRNKNGFTVYYNDELTAKKEAIMNYKGELLTDFIYDYIDLFDKKFYFVKTGEKCGFLDLCGKEVIPVEYQFLSYYEEYIIAERDDNYGIINLQNEIIIPFEYKEIGEYTKDMPIRVKNSRFQEGYIDINNRIVIPFGIYNNCGDFQNGYAAVRDNMTNIFIDKNGDKLEIK